MEGDPYRLERFTAAQDRNGTYARALAELRAGAKRGHWMWFIFPQIEGLGSSVLAQEYAISGLDEARAYLKHPVLGPRLRECAATVAATEGKTAQEIFGSVDAMKLRSSMTLFQAADTVAAGTTAGGAGLTGLSGQGDSAFTAVLAKYFDGRRDEATLLRI
jgi:uncharacterized protein (DUF1810 family)